MARNSHWCSPFSVKMSNFISKTIYWGKKWELSISLSSDLDLWITKTHHSGTGISVHYGTLWFARVSVTQHHQLGGLQRTEGHCLTDLETRGVKARRRQGRAPPEASRGGTFLLFLASGPPGLLLGLRPHPSWLCFCLLVIIFPPRPVFIFLWGHQTYWIRGCPLQYDPFLTDYSCSAPISSKVTSEGLRVRTLTTLRGTQFNPLDA